MMEGKKMKKAILPILAIILGLSSCDFLDRTPKDRVVGENYFRNENDMILFSNGFYQGLFTNKSHERQSDIFFSKGTLSDEMYGGESRKVPNDASSGGWTWGQLRKINTMLGNIHKCPDEDVVAEYTALAKFFRARFYFEKVKRFGDVPWYDKELGSTDPELYNPRDSREFVMSKMIEDIDEAIAGLPEGISTYRVNKWAALMLKAQFCLYEGTFRKYHNEEDDPFRYVQQEGDRTAEDYLQLAAEAAHEILTQSPYSLAPDYGKMFRDVNADPNEYILSWNMDQTLSVTHNATLNATANNGTYGFSKKFIDSFLMKDGSRFTDQPGWETKGFVDEVKDRDPRLGAIIRLPEHVRTNAKGTMVGPNVSTTSTGFHYDKFVMEGQYNEAERSDGSFNDLPIYRFAEAHLIYAEAKAELGTITQDDLDLSINKLRARAGITKALKMDVQADPYLMDGTYGYPNLTRRNPDNLALILEIRRERTIELCLEGSSNYCSGRWDDIVRWKEGLCYLQPLHGIYIEGPGGYDLNNDGSVDHYFYDSADDPNKGNTSIISMKIITDGKYDGGGVLLSEGTKGYIDMTKGVSRSFDEKRDYLFPIPVEDMQFNKNLTQTPGWK